MLRKKVVIIIIFWLIPFRALFAQEIDLPDIPYEFVPKSPNVEAMTFSANTDINYAQGKVNFSIPIFEVKQGDISVPVSLDYNSNGLLVQMDASWVGLGWNLTANAVISRKVYGLPDDRAQLSYDLVKEDVSVGMDYTDLLNTVQQKQDNAPDIYSVSLYGRSVNFYISEGIITLLSPSELSVDNGTNNSFIITDEKGVKYVFDKPEEITIENLTGGSEEMVSYTSAWYLGSIISPNDSDIITFNYDSELIQRDNYNLYSSLTLNLDPKNYCNEFNTSYLYTSQLIDGYRLSSIETSSTQVEFVSSEFPREDLLGTSKQLEKIIIRKNTFSGFEPIKTFDLTFSYFITELGQDKRLKLDSLIEESRDNTPSRQYDFDYYSSGFFPSRASFSMDYWGYYNGQNNSTLIPKALEVDRTYGWANREPNEAACMTSMLKQVTYPTGGYTVFEYEQNEYSNSGENIKEPIQINANVWKGSSSNNFQTDEKTFTLTTNQTLDFNYLLFSLDLLFEEPDRLPTVSLVKVNSLGMDEVIFTYNVNCRSGCGSVGTTVSSSKSQYLSSGTYKIIASSYYSNTRASITLDDWIDTGISDKKKHGPGVRIKKILDYDYTNILLKAKSYSYDAGLNISSGKIHTSARAKDIDFYSSSIVAKAMCQEECLVHTINSNFKNPLFFDASCMLFYEEIQEYYLSFENEADNEGKTEYLYEMDVSNPYDAPKLTNKLVYKKGTNGLSLVNSIENNYNTVTGNLDMAYVPTVMQEITCMGLPNYTFGLTSIYTLRYFYKYLDRIIETQYEGENAQVSVKKFEYALTRDPFPRTIEFSNSVGGGYVKKIKYPKDYNPSLVAHLLFEKAYGIPIETQIWSKQGEVSSFIRGDIRFFDLDIQPVSVYRSMNETPLSSLNQEGLSNGLFNNLFSDNSIFYEYISLEYDRNRLHSFSKDGLQSCYLWDNFGENVTGYIINSPLNSTAFTNFESSDKGQFTYTGATATSYYRTGAHSYYSTSPISKGQLPAGTYTVSLWARKASSGTSSVTVNGTSKSVSSTWTLLEWEITLSSSGTITVTPGSDVCLDDLRLHPKGAQMTSYTYAPGIGMTSQTDANGRTTYYEYDGFGRLYRVKDEAGKILNEYTYHYKGQQ